MNGSKGNSKTKIVKTVCSTCHSCCGVLAHVKDGKAIKIEGDPEYPINKGGLCIKGLSGLELLYHPDRLNYPMIRVGEKGEGKWQKITWDETLDIISENLNKIKKEWGPEAIGITRGGGMYGNIGIVGYFAYLLGTPNSMASSFICFQPHVAAVRSMIGYSEAIHATEVLADEILNSQCVLLWAANPKEAGPYPVGEGIFKIKKQGAKLIVVDPRPTEFAKIADLWLQIRPSTDDALALGMLNVVINERLYDKEFVEKWTYGFEKLEKHIQKYTPEFVSEIAWVSPEDIKKAARMFASTKPACVCQRVPLDQNCNAVQTSQAILTLNAICGNFDKKGGNLLPAQVPIIPDTKIFSYVNKLPPEVLNKRIGAKDLPLLSGPNAPPANVHPFFWTKAVLEGKPYPVKALISSSRNWMIGDQNTRLIEKMLKALEFNVTIDHFMTPTAELSDIVLPAACWLEREGLRGHPGYPYVTPVQHCVAGPLYERWDDLKIFIELAKRMNFDVLWTDVEGYMDYKLKDMGITLKDLRDTNYIANPKKYDRLEKGEFEIKTPTKKIEIYSHLLEELGYSPLPQFVEPPEITPDYPLILMGGKKRVEYLHSAGKQIPMLRESLTEPTIEINPQTADQYGISEGDWVWVETIYFKDLERAKFKACLLEGSLPRVVSVEHGWWFPERTEPDHGCFESNINVVIPLDIYDPLFGCTNLRSIPCRIYKAEEQNKQVAAI